MAQKEGRTMESPPSSAAKQPKIEIFQVKKKKDKIPWEEGTATPCPVDTGIVPIPIVGQEYHN